MRAQPALSLLLLLLAVAATLPWEAKGRELKEQPNDVPPLTNDQVADGSGAAVNSNTPGANSGDSTASEQKPKKDKYEAGEKKSKDKSDDFSGDSGSEKKSDKKSKSKIIWDDSKNDGSKDDSKKKSKLKTEDADAKKSKLKTEDTDAKKKSKSKSGSDNDFDAIPAGIGADAMAAADTPDGNSAPAKADEQMPASDTPDGNVAPKAKVMTAADTPDGFVPPTKAKPMSAADTPDGYVPADTTKPQMPADDSPDGDVAPSGGQPKMAATDTPDGYAAPKKPNVNVQSVPETAPGPSLKAVNPTVKAMCAKAEYPAVCEASISKLPEAGKAQDGVSVLSLSMDAARAKIAEAKNAGTGLASDPHTDKFSKGAITDCLEMYDDMNDNFDTALGALKRGDKPSASTALDAARTDVDSCDNGFQERPELKPVMAKYDNALAQLSSNVLAINSAMK